MGGKAEDCPYVEDSTRRCITYRLENEMKSLLLATLLAITPLAVIAQPISDTDRELLCNAVGRLAGVTATYRDKGQSASTAYVALVEQGLNEEVALGIIKIVYDKMPTAAPESVAGISYIACLEATK